MSKLVKIAENKVSNNKSKTIEIENRDTVTYLLGNDRVYITRDASIIELCTQLIWESGRLVTDIELKEIEHDLIVMSELLDAGFEINKIKQQQVPLDQFLKKLEAEFKFLFSLGYSGPTVSNLKTELVTIKVISFKSQKREVNLLLNPSAVVVEIKFNDELLYASDYLDYKKIDFPITDTLRKPIESNQEFIDRTVITLQKLLQGPLLQIINATEWISIPLDFGDNK